MVARKTKILLLLLVIAAILFAPIPMIFGDAFYDPYHSLPLTSFDVIVNKLNQSRQSEPSVVPAASTPSVTGSSSCCSLSQQKLGYECVQECGPPIAREETPPTYKCLPKDEAEAYRKRPCPICLASNTMIATPLGEVNVKDLKIGMLVWSVDVQGQKVSVPIIKHSQTPVPSTHHVVHLVLVDGREVWVSPNHPGVNNSTIQRLGSGDIYDGSIIQKTELIPYWDSFTYDLLPDSSTGFYWANGILLASTLKN